MWDRNASEFWVLKHDFGPHFWCQVSKVSKVSSVSTPKAKAKGKAKTKAKDAAIEKAECQKIEAPKVSWLKSLEILLHSLNKAQQGLTISKDEFMNSNFLYLSEFIERVVSYDILWLLSSFLTGFDPWILVGVFQDVAPPKPKPPLSHRIMWNTKGTGKFLRWDGVFNLWIDLKFRNQAMRFHSRTLVETLQSVVPKAFVRIWFLWMFFHVVFISFDFSSAPFIRNSPWEVLQGTAKKWRICCKSCTLQLRILCVSTFGSGSGPISMHFVNVNHGGFQITKMKKFELRVRFTLDLPYWSTWDWWIGQVWFSSGVSRHGGMKLSFRHVAMFCTQGSIARSAKPEWPGAHPSWSMARNVAWTLTEVTGKKTRRYVKKIRREGKVGIENLYFT